MTESKLYWRGVPVGPDVDVLDRHFNGLTHGQVLAHDDLSDVMGYSRGSSRYRSVINAWRRQLLREHGIELQSVRSIGLRVMTDPERVDAHVDKAALGIRKIARAGKSLSAIPRSTLTTAARTKADHAQILIASMRLDASAFKSELQAPKPAPQSPRLVVADARNVGADG